MKIKKYNEFNESWKSALIGLYMVFTTSCDMVTVNGDPKFGKFETEGTVIDVIKIYDGDNCQYWIKVEDKDGNIIEIGKYSMTSFVGDETPSMPFLSDLEEGSKVKIVCSRDCKIYLKEE